MTKHEIVAGINCIVIAAVLVALIAKVQSAYMHKPAVPAKHTTQLQETSMKEHTQLLQLYRQRIEGLFADVEGMLRQVEQDHSATEESLVMQMADVRDGFAEVGADIAAAVVAEAKQARQSAEPSDSE